MVNGHQPDAVGDEGAGVPGAVMIVDHVPGSAALGTVMVRTRVAVWLGPSGTATVTTVPAEASAGTVTVATGPAGAVAVAVDPAELSNGDGSVTVRTGIVTVLTHVDESIWLLPYLLATES